jgi:hypothetical protein
MLAGLHPFPMIGLANCFVRSSLGGGGEFEAVVRGECMREYMDNRVRLPDWSFSRASVAPAPSCHRRLYWGSSYQGAGCGRDYM